MTPEEKYIDIRDAVRKLCTRHRIEYRRQLEALRRQHYDAGEIAGLAVFPASGIGGKISGQVIGVDVHTETLANWLDET